MSVSEELNRELRLLEQKTSKSFSCGGHISWNPITDDDIPCEQARRIANIYRNILHDFKPSSKYSFFVSKDDKDLKMVKKILVTMVKYCGDTSEELRNMVVVGGELADVIDHHRDGSITDKPTKTRTTIDKLLGLGDDTQNSCGCGPRG